MSIKTADPKELARELLRKRSQPTEKPEIPVAAAERLVRLEQHPGLYSMRENMRVLDELGIENPYFQCAQARNGASVQVNGEWRIDFSNFDYLGLARDAEVCAAAVEAIGRYGASVSAARIVGGEIRLFEELEEELATLTGTQAGVVVTGGFLTNVATVGCLFGKEDLILHDQLAHNSMVTGSLLSGARRLAFAHNDPDALERSLRLYRHQYRFAAVLIEGVYSMDGDIAPVPEIVKIARKYGAVVMVDEAHSLGTLGPSGLGVRDHFGLAPTDIDIWMGTLSKALGSCGGYVCGSRALIENLKYNAPGVGLYATGMAPSTAAAALCALRKLRRIPSRVLRLQSLSARFLTRAKGLGLNTGTSGGTPIVPVIIGSSISSFKLASSISRRGINAYAISYPVVPEEASRVRFFITSEHKEADIDRTVDTVAAELEAIA